jgi:starch phosphorylase
MIETGFFSPEDPTLFHPILSSLLDQGDHFMVLADYRAYIEAQASVELLYKDRENWARKSIINTAHMGFFSSDRAVHEYAERIWSATPFGAS